MSVRRRFGRGAVGTRLERDLGRHEGVFQERRLLVPRAHPPPAACAAARPPRRIKCEKNPRFVVVCSLLEKADPLFGRLALLCAWATLSERFAARTRPRASPRVVSLPWAPGRPPAASLSDFRSRAFPRRRLCVVARERASVVRRSRVGARARRSMSVEPARKVWGEAAQALKESAAAFLTAPAAERDAQCSEASHGVSLDTHLLSSVWALSLPRARGRSPNMNDLESDDLRRCSSRRASTSRSGARRSTAPSEAASRKK